MEAAEGEGLNIAVMTGDSGGYSSEEAADNTRDDAFGPVFFHGQVRHFYGILRGQDGGCGGKFGQIHGAQGFGGENDEVGVVGNGMGDVGVDAQGIIGAT